MIGYPPSRLLEEVAFLAHHLHWSYHDIMAMEHCERRWWLFEVARLQERPHDGTQGGR